MKGLNLSLELMIFGNLNINASSPNIFITLSAGHLCDLQGLFSDIDNLCRVNCNELQLSS